MDPPAPAGQGGWGLGYGMSKGALHRLAGIVAVELGAPGVLAFNLSPGFVATERIAMDMGGFGFDASAGAPADVVGAVAAWLVTAPEARERNGKWIEAQQVCRGAGPAAGLALIRPRPTGTVSAEMAEPTSTRDRLLDAAARLYAERGIDNVSLAEIVRAADQRNASAVHYHFGRPGRGAPGPAGPTCARHRRASAPAARRGAVPAGDGVRAAAEAIVRPVTEFAQRGWRERAYLQIGSEMTGAVDRTTPEIRAAAGPDRGAPGLGSVAPALPGVPADLWRVRREICIAFIGRAAADRARQLDRGDEGDVLSDDRFVDNLVDMVVGAMTAAPRRRMTSWPDGE